MYVRKTYDVWRVYVHYSYEYGFEEVYEAQSRAEARKVQNDYQREGHIAIVKKHRVRKEA